MHREKYGKQMIGDKTGVLNMEKQMGFSGLIQMLFGMSKSIREVPGFVSWFCCVLYMGRQQLLPCVSALILAPTSSLS